MTTTKLDLAVAAPEDVERVLLAAADKYRESAGELMSAWQDAGAGRVWARIAGVLERAAKQCATALEKEGL